MDLLEQLNPVQREAVTHPDGPLLIFAGAGSGKTRVLTHRVAWLIRERGVHPAHILAVTFTNKAAKEMKTRIASLVGSLEESIWIGTFHALAARMLRMHGEHIGLDPGFVIYDDKDQETVVKECYRELDIDEKKYAIRATLNAISRAKERLIEPREYGRTAMDSFERVVANVYPAYNHKLRLNNALDFDDLIGCAVKLLREAPSVREEIQHRFRQVLVDEFQDINHAQYAWMRLVAGKHGNVTVVGDDDQSIYSWRGADVGFILAFERDYPDARVVKLEQNYRSTQKILSAAHGVVSRNRMRVDKKLWTDGPEGKEVTVYSAYDEYDEARYVCQMIAAGCMGKGRSYRDHAVLYRMNSQSRALEDELRRMGIPYRVVGGLRFYDRKEVKDLIAYLRLVANPADSISLRRVINAPPRGIGATTMARLGDYAMSEGISLFEAMRRAGRAQGIQPAIRKRVADFVLLIDGLRELAATATVLDTLKAIIARTGFEQTLQGETVIETDSRKANVQELLKVAEEFVGGGHGSALSAFLEEMALVSDVDNLREDEDGVALMTLHAAKGLEFPVIFMVGLEEGIFPHSRSMGDDAALEEERRLCYVGITRAMQELYLLHACRRASWGTPQYNPPSRFLKDLPPSAIARDAESARFGQAGTTVSLPPPPSPRVADRHDWEWDSPSASTQPGTPLDAEAILARYRPAEPAFRPGDKVQHATFGTGVVLSVEGEGDTAEVRVHFAGKGMKRLALAYAQLSKLGSGVGEPGGEDPAPEESAAVDAPEATEVVLFARGDRVVHRRFGTGTVVSVHGEGPTAEVTVQFGHAGTRRLDPVISGLERVRPA
ncbi:MAG TPA: UvrD-helicase domain-containing protein [Armatimonadota bacterium]|nr:UvrD-helicase domain-containing protein [Armatimonadota bacterium]